MLPKKEAAFMLMFFEGDNYCENKPGRRGFW